MFNVCDNCGTYHADKVIDPTGHYAICQDCGHKHRFALQPLMIICGPSGAGKTTVCNRLIGRFQDAVILDGDILWGVDNFFNTWLRMAKNIGQSGRPVVLFSSGAIPPNIEPCVEARYFSAIHYLALVYDDKLLEERLKARPEWRNSRTVEFITDQLNFNRWFKEQAAIGGSKMTLLDTTQDSIDVTTQKVTDWIDSHL